MNQSATSGTDDFSANTSGPLEKEPLSYALEQAGKKADLSLLHEAIKQERAEKVEHQTSIERQKSVAANRVETVHRYRPVVRWEPFQGDDRAVAKMELAPDGEWVPFDAAGMINEVTREEERLRKALANLVMLFKRPEESSYECFERVAQKFEGETGHPHPGKTGARSYGKLTGYEAWSNWVDSKTKAAIDALETK